MSKAAVLTVLAMAFAAMSCGEVPEYLAPRNLGFEAPFCDGPLILCDPGQDYEECLAEKIAITHDKLAEMFEHAPFIAYVDMDYDYSDMIAGMSLTNFRKFEITQILKNNLSVAGVDQFVLEGGYDDAGLCDSGEHVQESVYSGANLVFGNTRCMGGKITVVIFATYPIEAGLIYDPIGRSGELAPLLEGINWGEDQIPAEEICVPETES